VVAAATTCQSDREDGRNAPVGGTCPGEDVPGRPRPGGPCRRAVLRTGGPSEDGARRSTPHSRRSNLATTGLNLGNVVKTTYFVTDVSLREEANQQFLEAFAEPRPARTFVEVSALPYGATVEIEAVAHATHDSG
jgi:Putative translation initiation inhibitor, yjgF family